MRIFELELIAATVVIQIFAKGAIGSSACTRHLVAHAFMHAFVFMRLCGWAVRTIVVLHRLQRHRAGLQRQIQPHSHEQTQGTTGPGLMSLSDVGQQAQVIVSTMIFAVSRNHFPEAIAISTCSSRARVPL